MDRRTFLQFAAASGGLTIPESVFSQPDGKSSPDEMIHKYLAGEVARLDKTFLAGATTAAEWKQKRPALQKQFLEMLGLDPLPEKSPLKATVTGTFEHAGVVVENLHFQSRPGLYVTANLYRPKTAGKCPAILYVCGHSGRGRDGNKTAFQDHGLWFAANGYVCLVVDTLQLGEIPGIHHGTYREGRWWWHDRGYTPAGVECWNGIRGIDYLCSRPEVDPEKIGVTGISGGGATTVWVAATDDRVKVAVPVSGMSDLESYVTNKVVNGHCDCMFAHNTYQWEWTTILALFAPKPLLFANSDNDGIFPMDGNRRIVARLRQCYELLGAKDKVDEYVSKGGHDYRPDLRLAVFRFFHTHLKGDNGKIADADFPKIEGKRLRAFPEDADVPKDAINGRVDEVFVPKAEVKLPAAAKDFPAWKAGLVKQLREKCFRALPAKVPWPSPDARWAAVQTEPGVFCLRTNLKANPPRMGPIVQIVLNADEETGDAKTVWEKRFPNDDTIVGFYPRGSGIHRWTRKNPPNTVERSLALLGQTADSGRVRDVIADLDSHRSSRPVRVVGRGPAGIIAAYAVLLQPGLTTELVILDPPASHRDGPHFLNVLRVLDLPEALGLLAPDVSLTLVGETAKDPAFDKTAAIYKLAGAEGKFKRE